MRYLVLIAILSLMVIVSGCTEQTSSEKDEPQAEQEQPPVVVTSPPVTPPPEPEPKVDTCEQWAQKLIPEKVQIFEGANRCDRTFVGVWEGGEPIKLIGTRVEFIKNSINKRFKIEAGSDVGEDTNLFYLKSYNNEYLKFGYDVDVVNSDAVVVGKRTFEVSVKALKQLEGMDADEIDCIWYNYSLVDVEVTSCNKVASLQD